MSNFHFPYNVLNNFPIVWYHIVFNLAIETHNLVISNPKKDKFGVKGYFKILNHKK
jgi:hypothetical protein